MRRDGGHAVRRADDARGARRRRARREARCDDACRASTSCHSRARVSRAVARGVDRDHGDEEEKRARDASDGMRRTDSLTHIEQAMSSVKSLRGRGLDLPNTPRWLRRKHRCARGDE